MWDIKVEILHSCQYSISAITLVLFYADIQDESAELYFIFQNAYSVQYFPCKI